MANGQDVAPSIKKKGQSNLVAAHAHPTRPEQSSPVPVARNNARKGDPESSMTTHSNLYPSLHQNMTSLLEGQRKDIDRIMTSVDNLLQEMKTIKASMEYMKFQQKTFAAFTDNEAAKSPTTLTEDFRVLAERVTQFGAKANSVDSLAVQLDSITERVSKVSTGVNDVDRLKLELELMKQRIKRLERVNIDSQASNVVSKSETAFHTEVQRKSEPIHSSMNISQEIPSSTRSQSAQTLARLRRDSTMSLEGNEHDYVSDSAPEKLQSQTQTVSARHITPENDLVDLLQPQITSADKVAAQKRRYSRSSSSSSSLSITEAPQKRTKDRSKIYGRPDWSTKPALETSAKRKLTSLNDPEHVLTSDPEDSDYAPDSVPQKYESPYEKDAARVRSKPPLRLPTPEWEKSDWETPFNPFMSGSARSRSTARRGVSGRGLLTDRNEARRRSSGYGPGDYVYAQSSAYWDDGSSTRRHSGTPDNDYFAKPRDSQGRLLRPDGRVDGRSLRHQRERAARAKLAAQQQLKVSDERQQDKTQEIIVSKVQNPMAKYVDAAALAAAGYVGTPKPAAVEGNGFSHAISTGQSSSKISVIKQESDTTDISAAVPVLTAATATAVPTQAEGSDTHAKLMKQMFPWR